MINLITAIGINKNHKHIKLGAKTPGVVNWWYREDKRMSDLKFYGKEGET